MPVGERWPDGFEHTPNRVAAERCLHAIEDDTEYATDYLSRFESGQKASRRRKRTPGGLTIAQYAPIMP